jgi:hypothetical protein
MEHNYHSTNNQRVLSKLVDREVIANQSYLVTELLKHHYDEAEWTNVYVDNSEEMEELNTKIHELVIKKDITENKLLRIEKPTLINYTYRNTLKCRFETLNNRISNLESMVEELEEEQDTLKEPLEWWLVTGWFVEKLKRYGEVFVEIFGETWWSRTCTGQAIQLDYVIGRIGEDMDILEGQENHKFWRD